MKTSIKILVVLFTIVTLSACKKEIKTNAKFVLNGNIKGVTTGKVILTGYTDKGRFADTTNVEAGNFQFKGDFEKPEVFSLEIDKGNPMENPTRKFYVENTTMQLEGDVSVFSDAIIKGSNLNRDYDIYLKGLKIIEVEYQSKQFNIQNFEKLTPKEKEEVRNKAIELLNKKMAAISAYESTFMDQYPDNYQSGVIAARSLSGKSSVELKKIVDAFPAGLQKHPLIVEALQKAGKMEGVEVSLEQMMAKVENVSYKVDMDFKGESYNGVVYLGAFTNNNICALQGNGTIQILDEKGKKLKEFKPEIEGMAKTVAVDSDDNIYVIAGLVKTETRKYRGRSMTQEVSAGVECNVFSKQGKFIKKFPLEGLITSTGARVADNKLIVSDFRTKKIAMFDKESGAVSGSIEDMRPCCGILDFSVNKNNQILVANLGGFRVQSYNFDGKTNFFFGNRGRELNDFHGCCNPVSVATLQSGAILTVEKDPTRIKVFSKEGAKQVEGIQELVKGCSYIPMIVDGNDNVYLASQNKGIVKCIIN